MLLSSQARATVEGVVSGVDFYRPAHGQVFDAIGLVERAGRAVDAVTVADELGRQGTGSDAGGVAGLLALTSAAPSTSAAGSYAATVRRYSVARQLIAAGGTVADVGYEAGDVDDMLAAADDAVRVVADRESPTRLGALADRLGGWLDAMESRVDDGPVGVQTGWADLDAKIAGLPPFTVIGARPSVGKTMLGWALAQHVAARSQPALFVSIEMTEPELHDRLVASEAGLRLDHVRRGTLGEGEWQRIAAAFARLSSWPLFVDATHSATLATVRASIRRVQHQAGRCVVCVVDYMQKMRHPGEHGEARTAAVSEGLKSLALELGVPVVALAQLSREVESRGDKMPILADLRGSGQIEQDADLVALLHREEMHDPKTERRGLMDVIVAKQRNGPTGTVVLQVDVRTGRLWDVPRTERAEPLAMAFDSSDSQ